MEQFNHILESDSNKFSIFFISDIHEGNCNFNEKAFEKCKEYIIKKEKERKISIILGGDMIDCITYRDPRFSPIEISEKYKLKDLKDLPKKQMQNISKKMEGIKKNINYALIGNHEAKCSKHSSNDIYDYFCSDLMPNCKKLGMEGIGNLIFRIGKCSKILKTIMCHPEKGGSGFREGYPMNFTIDVFKKFDCDIYWMPHLHRLESKTFEYITVNKNGEMIKKYKIYIITGGFLETYVVGNKNYFEGRKGQSSDVGFPELEVERSNGIWRYRILKHKWMNGKYEIV